MKLNPKENYLNCLLHKETEYLPLQNADCANVGTGVESGPWFEKGPVGGGMDGFGINWVCPVSAGGAPTPDPRQPKLLNIDNFLQWRDLVKIPNVEEYDWEQIAALEYKRNRYDPECQALNYGCGNGIFERLTTLMGFEDALIALVEEPEEVQQFFETITEFKIATARKVKEYFRPDTFTNYDDIATERGPFMSAAVYRELIKPYHTRLHQAVRELDMIPVQHICGNCEMLIEDIIDTGAQAWVSVQPMNDIAAMLEKYAGQICLIGGYDTNGKAGRMETAMEERFAEIERCLRTYGKYPDFVMFMFVIASTFDPAEKARIMIPMIRKFMELSGRS